MCGFPGALSKAAPAGEAPIMHGSFRINAN